MAQDTSLLLNRVMSRLPLVEEMVVLEEIAGELELEVPEENKGNRKYIFRLIMNYLNSDQFEGLEDQGHAHLLKVLEFLDNGIKPEVEAEAAHDVKIEENPSKTVLSLHKLKDFKINGSIGNLGQKDKLSYGSLSYQIQNGKEQGYSDKEICCAVIRAMTPGSTLRNYLEGYVGMDLKFLIKVLRSHFKEKDATSVFTEMSNAVQQSSENELEFCMRLMGLRQKVLTLSKEEDCAYEAKLVQTKFQHALFTGLKHNNVRHELRDMLRGGVIKDEELLQGISDVMVNESEHLDKIHGKSKVAINELSSREQTKGETKKKEKGNTNLLTEISKLTAQVSELSGLKKDFEDLKSVVKGMSGSSVVQPVRYRKFLCLTCRSSNASYCNHCFLCGGSDHKRNMCPHRGPSREHPKN